MRLAHRLRPRARLDIEAVSMWYSEHADMGTAARFADAVNRVAEQISEYPWSGKHTGSGGLALADLRSRTVIGFDAYVIFYAIVDDEIEIVRVLHGARDVERVLLDDDEPDVVHEGPIGAESIYVVFSETAWRVAC